jgi:hypothetical protein
MRVDIAPPPVIGRQVEDDVGPFHGVGRHLAVSKVSPSDSDLIDDIGQVFYPAGAEIIDDPDIGTECHELFDEMTRNEGSSAGDEHRLVLVVQGNGVTV